LQHIEISKRDGLVHAAARFDTSRMAHGVVAVAGHTMINHETGYLQRRMPSSRGASLLDLTK
jgi:hypothetical protein